MELVDTDVLIDYQRGHAPAKAWFASRASAPCVAGFVVMELLQAAKNASQVQAAQKLVAPLQVIWPGAADCDRAVSLFSRYHLSHGLGLLDSLIAVCALSRSATLFTFNLKHYQVVPSLKLAKPYKR